MHIVGWSWLPIILLQHFLYDYSCRKTLCYSASAKRTRYEVCITLSLADLKEKKTQEQGLLILGFLFFQQPDTLNQQNYMESSGENIKEILHILNITRNKNKKKFTTLPLKKIPILKI